MKEREVERYFVNAIQNRLGAVVRKLKFIGQDGAPDRIVFVDGRVWLAEIKAPGKKPRANQLREIQRLRNAGAIVLVVDCREAVDTIINHHKKGLCPSTLEYCQ